MSNNKRFKVVWDVLNALRAHDDRFNAMINSIDLDKDTKGKIGISVFGGTAPETGHDTNGSRAAIQPMLFQNQMRDAILARIVKKVGERDYWDSWADDVVHIHSNQVTRITSILAQARATDGPLAGEFDTFLAGLQATINDSITVDGAIDMLSQHLITQPVFDALFPTGSFAHTNPVSVSMQRMITALEGQGLQAETDALAGFYASVRRSASTVESPAGRQTVIHRLYEDFFKKSFPAQAASLGVVYTPVEVVDFIVRAADQVCREQFGFGLTDKGVHVLEPKTSSLIKAA